MNILVIDATTPSEVTFGVFAGISKPELVLSYKAFFHNGLNADRDALQAKLPATVAHFLQQLDADGIRVDVVSHRLQPASLAAQVVYDYATSAYKGLHHFAVETVSDMHAKPVALQAVAEVAFARAQVPADCPQSRHLFSRCADCPQPQA